MPNMKRIRLMDAKLWRKQNVDPVESLLPYTNIYRNLHVVHSEKEFFKYWSVLIHTDYRSFLKSDLSTNNTQIHIV